MVELVAYARCPRDSATSHTVALGGWLPLLVSTLPGPRIAFSDSIAGTRLGLDRINPFTINLEIALISSRNFAAPLLLNGRVISRHQEP